MPTKPPLGSTMRVHQPYKGVYAFYDGRIDGVRAYSEEPNWLDDGAYALGVCSYAIVSGEEALVYDTSISNPHAALIRNALEEAGGRHIRVVLSHWHVDHVAGNAVFADCEIIANDLTAQALIDNKERLENDTPPIRPLVMPNSIFKDQRSLMIGEIEVELRHVDIHSHDGTVMILPHLKLLFAGDALEEPITYVAEPKRLGNHLWILNAFRPGISKNPAQSRRGKRYYCWRIRAGTDCGNSALCQQTHAPAQ